VAAATLTLNTGGTVTAYDGGSNLEVGYANAAETTQTFRFTVAASLVDADDFALFLSTTNTLASVAAGTTIAWSGREVVTSGEATATTVTLADGFGAADADAKRADVALPAGTTATDVFTLSTGKLNPGTYYVVADPTTNAYADSDAIVMATIYVVETPIGITSTATAAFAMGAGGQAGTYRIRMQGDTTLTTAMVNPKGRITAAPADSTIDVGILVGDGTVSNGQSEFAAGTMTANGPAEALATGTNLAGKTFGDFEFDFWPDIAGTYTFLFFNDVNNNGLVDGADSSHTLSIAVGGSISTIAAAAQVASAPTKTASTGLNGALVKITVKDANGNAVAPTGSDAVLVSVTGSAKIAKVNDVAISETSSWSLGQLSFDSTGTAYINVVDAVAESVTLSAAGTGSLASSVAATPIGLTFAAAAGTVATTTGVLAPKALGVWDGDKAGGYTVPVGASSITITGTASAATAVVPIRITDTNGRITGLAGADYDVHTTAVASELSYSVSMTSTATSQGYSIGWDDTNSSDSFAVASAAVNFSDAQAVMTVNPTTVQAVAGATTSILVNVKDQFGRNAAGAVVSVTHTGRNTSAATTNLISDASGNVTFTYTDTATTSSNAIDTISFSAVPASGTGTGTETGTASVTYGAANSVDTVTVTSGGTTLGVAKITDVPADIPAGLAGPSAVTATVTATVKNASGVLLAGVPVTFTVAGTGVAVPSSSVTAFTNASGVATSAVYGWIAGTYTVTATAGGKSGTGAQTFRQESASEVRTISATATGARVVVTAKDRFGNPVVANARIYATITAGAGYFGSNGTLSTSALTDLNGQATFVVAGGNSTVRVSTIDPAGTGLAPDQTTAAAGNHVGQVTTPVVFTATTVGTTTTAETGVGASFAPAGVSSATVEVTVTNEAADAATAASDAAAEATDAANAATDAANAAAEAADAATAAAQDAADAVAALATSVEAMVNALKRQITSLTNLVIKIQKKVRA
jgi:hypothetical protein